MSSTIKQAILSLKSRIADAFAAVEAKGGTLPAQQTATNLPTAIASIPNGPDRTKSFFVENSSDLGTPKPIGEQTETLSDEGEIWMLGSVGLHDDYKAVIKHIKLLHTNTNGVTSMRYAWSQCPNLESVELGEHCNFGWCTNFEGAFYGWPKVNELDFSMISFRENVSINTSYMFLNDTNLTTLRVGSGWTRGVDLSTTGLLHDGLVQFFNDLPTINTSQTITIGADKQALLTAQEIAIATDKGWQIA